MSTPTTRARHRDNAAKLGKFQTSAQEALNGLNVWLDTTAGQLSLIGLMVGLLLAAGLIGR